MLNFEIKCDISELNIHKDHKHWCVVYILSTLIMFMLNKEEKLHKIGFLTEAARGDFNWKQV